MARLITDHVFRGDRHCLYGECGQVEEAHSESADSRPPQVPHWFLGVRFCLECGIGFNHPSHCLSPAWMRLVLAT
jgi:hypothetical protein